ncbi:hypothetical protein HaLaN_27194, partial [Haematococcus lacustris]
MFSVLGSQGQTLDQQLDEDS